MKQQLAGIALWILLLGPALAGPEEEGIIRLKDGNFLFGKVLSHSEEGLKVERLDTGGVVDLTWSHLFPAEEDKLREKFGYKDRAGEEVLTEVDRLLLDDGSERIGVIISRTEKDILMRIKGNLVQVPKARVAAPAERIQVNALDIFTRDQLYELKVAELQPETAEQYLELGRYLVRIRDLQRALEAYQKVQELDSSYHPDEVRGGLARLKVQAAKAEEIAHIDEIDTKRGRGKFTEALLLVKEFQEKWPRSTFTNEVLRKRDRIEEDREALLARTVVTKWYFHADRLAAKVAADREMTVQAIKNHAEQKLSSSILERVTWDAGKVKPGLTTEEVREIWQNRGKLARSHRSTYGEGTFILGKEQAQKGMTKEEDNKQSESDAQKEMRERVQKYLKELDRQKKLLQGTSEDDPAETWWKKARASEKHQWLLSYYAEFGGDMVVTRPFFKACRSCGGKGVLERITTARGSGSEDSSGKGGKRVTCPTCHRVQVLRGIYYQ